MSTLYNGYKSVFLDVETTGTDFENNNIFQICAIVTDEKYEEIDRIDLRFTPLSMEHVAPEALQKTGMTADTLDNLQLKAPDAYRQFVGFLSRHCDKYNKADKLHFVAYNAKFDADFMREFFKKNGDSFFGSWFWNPPICVMQAAAWMTMRVRGALPNFRLETLCKCAELGWDDSRAHDASYDIAQTLALFKYLRADIPQL
jgi:DNA polymerase III alpha subunit (gram-positive type)